MFEEEDETTATLTRPARQSSGFVATYSPEDNKLRLYSAARLSPELYARVKAAGFSWAPRQELFVAPAWTPSREDLLTELAGQIEDEDKSLTARAEDRAERFQGYQQARSNDAQAAHKAVAGISEHIPLGQPILIGHHSERHARKDAERIENGMRKAVKMWETSQYWKDRAAGAISHAKYKELPAVRARRIKGLEADHRKVLKGKAATETCLAFWNREGLTREEALRFMNSMPGEHYQAWSNLTDNKTTLEALTASRRQNLPKLLEHQNRWLAHLDNRITYERAMLEASGGLVADKVQMEVGGRVLVRGEWVSILRINRKAGHVVSVSTNARYVSVRSVEQIKGYEPPTAAQAQAASQVAAISPLVNYPGQDFQHITSAQWKARHKDYKCTRNQQGPGQARHRVRVWLDYPSHNYVPVFITDEKRKDPPMGRPDPPIPRPKLAAPTPETPAPAPIPQEPTRMTAAVGAMKEALKTGVKVAAVPQLFPTPAWLARLMAGFAGNINGQRVLEPSAGTGHLIRYGYPDRVDGVHLVAVEENGQLATFLRQTIKPHTWADDCQVEVIQKDFLSLAPAELGEFDTVIMNPPFKNGEDIRHIVHAASFLKPHGNLVALCANGPRQQAQLKPLATKWMVFEPDTFKEQGTGVQVALMLIRK